MSTYAIGDVQGCFDELEALLYSFNFDPASDVLWFAGDLVNRGPKSLQTLKFIHDLKQKIVVLGNHDLHLLATAYGAEPHRKKDTFDEIISSKECRVLCDWLTKQVFFHHDSHLGYTMVHAGIYPFWDLSKTQRLAKEVESVLQSDRRIEFFKQMYGNKPDHWEENLQGFDRLRVITNCFTRIRFCDEQGRLDLHYKGPIGSQPSGLIPWFKVPGRVNRDLKIIFGHWAALQGKVDEPNLVALDTGCVWGKSLSAFRLEDQKFFRVPCQPESSMASS